MNQAWILLYFIITELKCHFHLNTFIKVERLSFKEPLLASMATTAFESTAACLCATGNIPQMTSHAHTLRFLAPPPV